MSRSRVLRGPALAAGLTALALPMLSAPAVAAEEDFGYSSKLTATPLQVEVFEPTIPLPASPQGEADFGYSRVVADSSSARSRASYLWPGDAIGEGAKTIEEGVLGAIPGFPEQISGPIYDAGYPFQVNATFPGGPNYQDDEPTPGAVQRAKATPEKSFAKNGYSSTCDTKGASEDDSGDGGGGGGGGDTPGLPELPIFRSLAALSTSSSLSSASAARAADEEEGECPIPADAGALISFGGYSSQAVNQVTEDGTVKVSARSAVSDVSLAAGLVTFSGVDSEITAKSKGEAPTASGKANYGTITIVGQEFAVGPEGVVAGPQKQNIPGLPDEPNAALAQLGITVEVPKPELTVEGKEFSGRIEGVRVTIDAETLSAAIKTTPLPDIVNGLPPDLGQLKSILQSIVFLNPTVVFHLGQSRADLLIAEPIELPPLPGTPPAPPAGAEAPPAGGTAGGGGGTDVSIGGGSAAAPSTDIPVDTSSGTPEAVAPTEVTPTSSPGLPPLNSIPGMLLFGGLLGGILAGAQVRRLGAAALGLGDACSSGLDSGLPDLRKA